MLDVFTRPLGSIKANFEPTVALSVSNELSTSIREPALGVSRPLTGALFSGPPACGVVGVGTTDVLTRSAQDLGAALTGGEVVVDVGVELFSVVADSSSTAGWPAAEAPSPTEGEASAAPASFVDAEVALTETL